MPVAKDMAARTDMCGSRSSCSWQSVHNCLPATPITENSCTKISTAGALSRSVATAARAAR
eukprot:CAMPEP_0176290800 /NCGR_PEP_ID=MMETSP0121_2-20121125/55211_1 /TAXON_ID=160619 /ORGANISM="Kryptoperidinium foliaceum, Strain CCMP 1326" /LENGTH=60 /DNA_ID=CAMNT_0017631605 /DNA_START=52 /DNA_END=231 /DNA_ORIENTATION=+